MRACQAIPSRWAVFVLAAPPKPVCSSLLYPAITSTGFCLPFAKVMERSSGMIQPSMIGCPPPSPIVRISSVDLARSSASEGSGGGVTAAAWTCSLFGLLPRPHHAHAQSHPAATLGDGALEKALRNGRTAQHADNRRAGGLAEDGDVVRIAAEVRDVGLDPP